MPRDARFKGSPIALGHDTLRCQRENTDRPLLLEVPIHDHLIAVLQHRVLRRGAGARVPIGVLEPERDVAGNLGRDSATRRW